jgi:hypothetical protein
MQKVSKMRNLAALAIVVYSDVSEHAAILHRLYQDNIQVFEDKDKATAWLDQRL